MVALAGGLTGSDGDLTALAAAAATGRTGDAVWLAGCAAELVVGAVAGLVYAVIFEWVTRRGGALVGLAVAIPHLVVAGFAVGFLPGTRVITAGVMPPGAFLEYWGGWVVAAFIAAHLIFGVVVGAIYGKPGTSGAGAGVVWLDEG
jgi:hypothetical protein